MPTDMEGFRSDRVRSLIPVPLARMMRRTAGMAQQALSEYIADILKTAHPGWQSYTGEGDPKSNREQNLAELVARNKATEGQKRAKDGVTLHDIADRAAKAKEGKK